MAKRSIRKCRWDQEQERHGVKARARRAHLLASMTEPVKSREDFRNDRKSYDMKYAARDPKRRDRTTNTWSQNYKDGIWVSTASPIRPLRAQGGLGPAAMPSAEKRTFGSLSARVSETI